MADEKILKDEILSDDELDNIAGGTQQELSDLYDAINNSYALKKQLKKSRPGNIDANEIAEILKKNIGAEIKYNENGANYYKNTDGKSVTHDYMIKWINIYDRCYDGYGM